jgi:hypothetical protein
MDPEVVLQIAEDNDLSITIKPDGTIVCPFEYDRRMLRYLYDAQVMP